MKSLFKRAGDSRALSRLELPLVGFAFLALPRQSSQAALVSERCSVETSGTKTDAASESNANAVCELPSGEEETQGKLLDSYATP
ncbi:hypothetical protein [uncultured Rikenella sp.]|uniref:hypothetical protein n=1 Tax=uncultured Rikenella sp. TaxID=368003 RepID=UPI0025FF1372|nr:hypothetical protein [uncultured Rikenella sp.]